METKNPTSEERVWAVLSYLWVLSLVALAARKRNDFIRFHARQGVFLFVVSLICMLIPLLWPLQIIIVIVALVAIVKAWRGEQWELPAVGSLAAQFGDWLVKTVKL